MKKFHALSAVLVGLFVAASVHAQAWPTKQPIKLIAVFPPGGSVDQVARIIAPQLQAQLGQSVIVENKGGASGAIGTAALLAAPADGYTFAVVFDTHGVNPSLIPNLAFDTKTDITPLVLVGTSAMVVSTPSASPFKSFANVVKEAKTKGKSVSYGTIGSGSLGHLAMALLAKSNAMDFTHIPYRGGGPLMTDAIAGHVPLTMGSVFLSKPHIDSGRLRPLAVTTTKRAPDLPNVPTIAESGFAGFDAPAWWAVIASAKTPPEIIRRMNEELNKVLKSPEIAKKLDAQGIDVVGGTVDSTRTFINRQIDIWGAVIKENGIKAD